MESLVFKASEPFSLGVELELQLVNTRDYNLARGATDLLERLAKVQVPGEVKPEIAESMIEINTGVHRRHDTLVAELGAIRDAVVAQADRLNIAVAGGGTHPFQQWSEQRIYAAPRFHFISELYGYLAKQFTVFGQHIHVGCVSGADAIYLTHLLARYMPHFIALSASSPFSQGTDTSFDSSRLNAVSAFPMSGCMPFLETWEAFNEYFARLRGFGIVESMKDFYWDIRPKPEFGTIEMRVCDTPLTVEKAAGLAAYAQALARRLLEDRPYAPSRDVYLLYNYNRFQACRFGLQGNFIDPYTQRHVTLAQDIADTVGQVAPHAEALGCKPALDELLRDATAGRNDAAWLREMYQKSRSFTDVVRLQTRRFRGRDAA